MRSSNGCLLGSRVVASTSSASHASLHTSAVLEAQSRRARSRARGKAAAEKRREAEAQAFANRPHVVLCYRPGDEAKLHNSDFARILVTPEQAASLPPPVLQSGTLDELLRRKQYNFGVRAGEKELLFKVLPELSVEGAMQEGKARMRSDPSMMHTIHQKERNTETQKAAMLARLMDLRNANAKGIAYENRRRIIAAFSPPKKPNDTGRPEVQGKLYFGIRLVLFA